MSRNNLAEVVNSQKQNQNLTNLPSSDFSWARVKIQPVTDAECQLPIERLSPASLAYIGDAVYELYIRTRYLLPPKRISSYHDLVVAKVRAEAQATYLDELQSYLTDAEKDIVKRGRNAAVGKPRRLSSQLYQRATSLETLIGYLYLTNPQRLDRLLQQIELD